MTIRSRPIGISRALLWMFIRSSSGTLKLRNPSFLDWDRMDNLWKAHSKRAFLRECQGHDEHAPGHFAGRLRLSKSFVGDEARSHGSRGRDRQSPSISPTYTTPEAIPTSSQILPRTLLGVRTSSPRYKAAVQITPLAMARLRIFSSRNFAPERVSKFLWFSDPAPLCALCPCLREALNVTRQA
jgi:hypothetical protein